VSDSDRSATVIVPDDQLSLAIGKEGQNARLAAKLTGWRIDIKSAAQAFSAGLTDIAPESSDGEHVEGDGRCSAVTASGLRCRNRAKPGTVYCSLHDKEAAK
jgi:N utilization substance protein A